MKRHMLQRELTEEENDEEELTEKKHTLEDESEEEEDGPLVENDEEDTIEELDNDQVSVPDPRVEELSSDNGRETLDACPPPPAYLYDTPRKTSIDKQKKEIEDFYYSSKFMQKLIFSDDVDDHKKVPVFDSSVDFSTGTEKTLDVDRIEASLLAVQEANNRHKAAKAEYEKRRESDLRHKKERFENRMIVKGYRKATHAVTVPAVYIKDKADIDMSKPETKTDGLACFCVLVIIMCSVGIIFGLYQLLEQPAI